MDWYDRGDVTIEDYSKDIPEEATLQDVYSYNGMNLKTDISYLYMVDKLG